MYKLLAADMDGTLLKDDKTISYSTYKAIQDARKKASELFCLPEDI